MKAPFNFRPFTFRLAALCLIAAFTTPAIATQTSDAQPHQARLLIALNDGSEVETIDTLDLAIGESRQIQREDGTLVTLTRAADALTIESDKKTIRIPTPTPGEHAPHIQIERQDGDGGKKKLMIVRGNHHDIDALDDDLERVLDGIDMAATLSTVRTTLANIDLSHVGDALDAIDLDNLDAQITRTLAQARDEAHAEGRTKLLLIRSKRTDADPAQ